jgi:hypothetical protein
MKPWVKKLGGGVLVVVSIASLLFSLVCLIQVWRLQQPLADQLLVGFDLAEATLETTDQGLVIVEGALTNVTTNISGLETASTAAAQSIHDTALAIDAFSTLFGNDLPQVITNTRTALASAQTSAAAIDGVLLALSNVPFIGVQYQPATSLGSALNDISVSLGAIPPSLSNIQRNLDTTNTNLLTLESQIIAVSQNIELINENLEQAQSVVDQYQTQVATARGMISAGKQAVPQTIRTAAWVLTFFVIWLAISQAGMLIQGIGMLATRLTSPENVGKS